MARKDKLLAMLESDPDDPFLNYALGQEFLSSGERADAITQFESVIERFPNYHAAHFQLGQVFAEDGETTKATEVVKAGIVAATEAGDQHAVSEMTGFLEMLGD